MKYILYKYKIRGRYFPTMISTVGKNSDNAKNHFKKKDYEILTKEKLWRKLSKIF